MLIGQLAKFPGLKQIACVRKRIYNREQLVMEEIRYHVRTPAKSLHSLLISAKVCLGLLSSCALHFGILSFFHPSFSANVLTIFSA